MSTSGEYIRTALALVIIGAALTLMRKKWSSNGRRVAYPPGPKGYPIIGNLLDFPRDPIWEGLTKMAQEYSE